MTEIAGIPAQFFEDALTIILDAHPAPTKSLHCDAVAVAEAYLPCRSTDERLDWRCIHEGVEAREHHSCIRRNLNLAGYYCECPKARDIETTEGARVCFYTINSNALCNNCVNGHRKKEACQFCGEVHD